MANDDQVRFSIEVTEAGEVLAVPGWGWQPTEEHSRQLAEATAAVSAVRTPTVHRNG